MKLQILMTLLVLSIVGCKPASNKKIKTGSDASAVSKGAEVIPDEISHCSWNIYGTGSYENSNTALGNLTVCQSRSTGNHVFVQVQTPSENVQVCFYPTTEVENTPVGIGIGKCLLLPDSKRIYRVELDVTVQGLGAMTGVLLVRNDLQSLPQPFQESSGFGTEAFEECSQEMKENQDLSFCQAFKEHGTYFYKKL